MPPGGAAAPPPVPGSAVDRPAPTPAPAAPVAPTADAPDEFSDDPSVYESYYEQEDVGDRPCSACGGTLVFDIPTQGLKCTHCGNAEEIVHAEGAAVEEQNIKRAMAAAHGMGDRLAHYEGEKEIICQNCGGHTTFTGTFTSTRCPYCATPLQRTDVHEAPDRLAVDGGALQRVALAVEHAGHAAFRDFQPLGMGLRDHC